MAHPTIVTTYLGDLRTQAVHQQSGMQIITDAPTDNQGRGEAFSPTDLTCASLGSCLITIVGIWARKHDLEQGLRGTRLDITKHMASDPRRIKAIDVVVTVPPIAMTDAQKQALERAALTCPVALSLHPDIQQNISFVYQ